MILVSLSALLAGCQKPKAETLALADGSFKASYAVDETLDLSAASINVGYSKGTENVAVTSDMVSGFDTRTTGTKTLTVTYESLETDFTYAVYNPENASKDIVTTARLILYAVEANGAAVYTVNLSVGDLSGIMAVSFSLESDESLGITKDLSETSITAEPEKWSCASAYKSSAKLKAVIYADGGNAFGSDGTLCVIKISGGTNRAVALKEITVSDGKKDYCLPVAD
jgi:hypothetical protein